MVEALPKRGAAKHSTMKRCNLDADVAVQAVERDDSDTLCDLLYRQPSLCHWRDHCQQTLLHRAASSNACGALQCLIENGADLYARDDESQWTPLHTAVYHGALRAAKLIIAVVGDKGKKAFDGEGLVPFDLIRSRFERAKSCTQISAASHFITDKIHRDKLTKNSNSNCKIVERGSLLGFGSNANFQLGLVMDSVEPRAIDTLSSYNVVSISLCSIGGAAVTQCGLVFCWGIGRYGRLGVGDDGTCMLPVLVESLRAHHTVAVAVASTHTAFLTADGDVYTCGRGFLGHGDTVNHTCMVPKLVIGLDNIKIVFISVSKKRTLMVSNDGDAYLLGYRMLDMGINMLPQPIQALRGVSVQRVLSTNTHFVALTAQGQVLQLTRYHHQFQRIVFTSSSGNEMCKPRNFHCRSNIGAIDISTSCGGSFAIINGNVFYWQAPVKMSSSVKQPNRIHAKILRGFGRVFINKVSSTEKLTCFLSAESDLWTVQHSSNEWCRISYPIRDFKLRCLSYVACGINCILVVQRLNVPVEYSYTINDTQCPTLMTMCERTACAHVNEKNVIAVLRFALDISSKSLRNFCFDFISENAEVILIDVLRLLNIQQITCLEPHFKSKVLPASLLQRIERRAHTANFFQEYSLLPAKLLRCRIRALAKKLGQIEQLSGKKNLNKEQLGKIAQREFIEQSLHRLRMQLKDSKVEEQQILQPMVSKRSIEQASFSVLTKTNKATESANCSTECSHTHLSSVSVSQPSTPSKQSTMDNTHTTVQKNVASSSPLNTPGKSKSFTPSTRDCSQRYRPLSQPWGAIDVQSSPVVSLSSIQSEQTRNRKSKPINIPLRHSERETGNVSSYVTPSTSPPSLIEFIPSVSVNNSSVSSKSSRSSSQTAPWSLTAPSESMLSSSHDSSAPISFLDIQKEQQLDAKCSNGVVNSCWGFVAKQYAELNSPLTEIQSSQRIEAISSPPKESPSAFNTSAGEKVSHTPHGVTTKTPKNLSSRRRHRSHRNRCSRLSNGHKLCRQTPLKSA